MSRFWPIVRYESHLPPYGFHRWGVHLYQDDILPRNIWQGIHKHWIFGAECDVRWTLSYRPIKTVISSILLWSILFDGCGSRALQRGARYSLIHLRLVCRPQHNRKWHHSHSAISCCDTRNRLCKDQEAMVSPHTEIGAREEWGLAIRTWV